MQPLFRPMEGHHQHQHFGTSFHHDMAAHRMNSTPISDEDELDMDDSVSLSSNADGSCTSPNNQLADNQINGNFNWNRFGYDDEDLVLTVAWIDRRSFGQFGWIGFVWIGIGRNRRSGTGQTLSDSFHTGAVGSSWKRVSSRELRFTTETLWIGRSVGASRIHHQGKLIVNHHFKFFFYYFIFFYLTFLISLSDF